MGSIFLPVVHTYYEKYDRYVRPYHSQQVVHIFRRAFSTLELNIRNSSAVCF